VYLEILASKPAWKLRGTKTRKCSTFRSEQSWYSREESSSIIYESEEFPVSRNQLKARVYSLLREKAHVPLLLLEEPAGEAKLS
jgi:hypothetical protein